MTEPRCHDHAGHEFGRRTGRASTVHAALAAALLAGVVTQAQQPPAVEAGKFAPAYLDLRAAEWQVAVRTHVGGQFDEPAESIAHWPPDLTRVVVDRAIRQRANALPASRAATT